MSFRPSFPNTAYQDKMAIADAVVCVEGEA
jgi:hypothetical protein